MDFLFFAYEKKSVSLGEKLIPVEIFELEQLYSKGSHLNKVENKSINSRLSKENSPKNNLNEN